MKCWILRNVGASGKQGQPLWHAVRGPYKTMNRALRMYRRIRWMLADRARRGLIAPDWDGPRFEREFKVVCINEQTETLRGKVAELGLGIYMGSSKYARR